MGREDGKAIGEPQKNWSENLPLGDGNERGWGFRRGKRVGTRGALLQPGEFDVHHKVVKSHEQREQEAMQSVPVALQHKVTPVELT